MKKSTIEAIPRYRKIQFQPEDKKKVTKNPGMRNMAKR